jgi:hypothetical protein
MFSASLSTRIKAPADWISRANGRIDEVGFSHWYMKIVQGSCGSSSYTTTDTSALLPKLYMEEFHAAVCMIVLYIL